MQNNFSEKQIKTVMVIFIVAIIIFNISKTLFFFLLIFIFYFLIKDNKKIQNIFKSLTNNSMSEVIDINDGKFSNIFAKFRRNMTFVFIAIVVIIFIAKTIIVVNAGYVGVYSLFGKVKDNELMPGIHFINPLAKVVPMSVRTEEYTMSVTRGEGRRKGADSISALTKEGLNVDLDITILYHLNNDKASDVYQKMGLSYEEKVMRPAIRSVIREIVAQYAAKDIYSDKRAEVVDRISKKLSTQLANRGISLENVLLRNVKLPTNLARSIQEKLQAEQEAEKYDFLLQKEKKEKQRKIIEAEGQRDAQKIINESLSTNYLYYLYLNQLKDRKGTIYVPTSPGTGMPLFKEIGK